MKNKKIRILVYAMAFLPFLTFLALYHILPDQMPGQWGINGEVRYDPKNSFFMFTSMSVLFAFMFDFLPKIDPRRQNYEKFGSHYDGFCLFMMVFLNGMCAIIFVESLRPGTLQVQKYVVGMVAILFLITGNMMPKVKSNFYMGIRTPWALSDTEVWNKSNRLGGYLMFGAGMILFVGNFILPSKILFNVLIGMVVVVTLVPAVMSYVWYRKKSEPKQSHERDLK